MSPVVGHSCEYYGIRLGLKLLKESSISNQQKAEINGYIGQRLTKLEEASKRASER